MAKAPSSLEARFDFLWRLLHPEMPEPKREYKAIPTRKFRFDFCWPGARVAVEMQGGIWSQGRHTRGKGYENDCIKRNLATAIDWQIYYLTSGMLNDNPDWWLGLIAEAIEEREEHDA